MDTYIVVREKRGGRWLYAVKVMTPTGIPEPLAFYTNARCAHTDPVPVIRSRWQS